MDAITERINARLREIGAEFVLFDRVRHVTQSEGKPGIVTSIHVGPYDLVYAVTWGQMCGSTHYAAELELADPDVWTD